MIPMLRRLRAGLLGGILLASTQAALAADVINGQKLYDMHCAVCHGKNGRPVMANAPSFERGERLMQPDFNLLASIRAGKFAMPAYAGVLRDREILDVIAYLRTFR